MSEIAEPIEVKEPVEPQTKVYPEAVVKDLIRQRDELKSYKSKVEEYEELIKQAQDEKLKENEDYKTLLSNKESELAELKKQQQDILQYKTKYEDLDKSLRESFINQLPEELREYAEDLSTVKLQKFAEMQKEKSIGMDTGRPGKSKLNIDGKKWEDFNSKDLEILKESDPDSYAKLYKTRYGRNP